MALDKNCKDVPYLIGRLTAILDSSIGLSAMQRVKAQTEPRSVLPYLVSEYHRKGDPIRAEELAEIMSLLPAVNPYPIGFATAMEQGQQTVGYYHEMADISKERNRRKIAKAIKLKRTELDMTQGQLAEKAGVTKQTVCNIESGDYNASIDVLSSIMAILGIKMTIE